MPEEQAKEEKSQRSKDPRPDAGGGPKKAAAGKPRGDRELDANVVRLGFAVALLIVAVIVGAIALFGGDSDDSSSSTSAPESSGKEVVGLSESELLARADGFGHAVYWVGPRVATESYELTTSEDGDVYIRYLTGDAEAGAEEADFLTIGSYQVADAQAALKQGGETAGGGDEILQEDGYEVLGSEEATNVYVVFDDEPELQVEVFSPQVGEAFALATSGALEPLG